MFYATTVRFTNLLNYSKIYGNGLAFSSSHKYYTQHAFDVVRNITCESSAVLGRSRIVGKASSERIVSVNGINLNVREAGHGLQCVLCLPGLVGTIETDFGKIFTMMDKSKYRLICFDPPGYGKSRPYVKTHEGDYYARDAEIAVMLLDKLGYGKVSIVGWSNGGMTGNALAAEFPGRVSHLVMIGAHAYCDDQVISHGLNVTNTKYWAKPALNTMLNIYGEEYLESLLKSYANSSRQFHRSGGAKIVEQRCPKIQCPTLVLHGSKDRIVPTRHAQYFFENIKNCQVHLIPGAGHNLHLTHTVEFLSLVDAFLQSLN